MSKKCDLAIVNRGFWPTYPVIGEALLSLAEKMANSKRVCVIFQGGNQIKDMLEKENRGDGVEFFPCTPRSTSSSGIFYRIIDAVFFSFFVFFALLRSKPSLVYISTDPPIIVPFIVMIYCRLFCSRYIYHIQDIHPEATCTIIKANKLIYALLRTLDNITIKHAHSIITITDNMKEELGRRCKPVPAISILANPSLPLSDVIFPKNKINGFSFCGNAGRLQRIPLLAEAIALYYDSGGNLPFVFAGGGIHVPLLKRLSDKYEKFHYFGCVPAHQALQISADYLWALLPIEDEVTRFAFPSKSSSYVLSGALLLAICSPCTSVAKWVEDNKIGLHIPPDPVILCNFFRKVESLEIDYSVFDFSRRELIENLSLDNFINHLSLIISS